MVVVGVTSLVRGRSFSYDVARRGGGAVAHFAWISRTIFDFRQLPGLQKQN
jgi:hypothetical protein